ncbi:hypothetical protein QUF55_04290 [Clostridiaceae bacterium HSG29]|nr:hypothetical protein [Clostridiaceae bacterium HSG29]
MNQKIMFFIVILILTVFLSGCGNNYSSDIKEVNDTAKIIENDFLILENNINKIAVSFSEIMETEISEKDMNDIKKKYKYSENGILYNPIYTDCSSGILSGYHEIDELLEEKLFKSEIIDKEFINVYNEFAIIDQVYLNSNDGLLRIYPGAELILGVNPKEEFSEFHFYYLADEEHNKEKKSVWLLRPYRDPVTQKWAVSLIAPSYGSEILCVIGFDFLIDNLKKQYLKKDMFLVSSDGNIIMTDNSYDEIFGLPNIENVSFYESFMGEIYLSDSYNLKKNKDNRVRELLDEIIKNNGEQFIYKLDRKYTVIVEKIDVIDSYLVKMISMD